MSRDVYPDVLGYLTGGVRALFNGVQAALAISPQDVRAGRPFHVLLLAQNATDVPVDLNATLNLPTTFLRRKTGRFAAPKDAHSVQLRPGEAGYLLMPVNSHPEAASGDHYKLGVTLRTQPQNQPRQVRSEIGGRLFDPQRLPEKRRATLEKLRQLEYVATKRLGREELEASFRVIPGSKIQTEATTQGGWFSLWTLAEDGTPAMLLSQYGTLLRRVVFPKLKKSVMFEPLRKTTEDRFRKAGYALKPLEAVYIAKLLTLVVHMTDPDENTFDYLGSQRFNVTALLQHDLTDTLRLPRWFEGLVRGIAHDETMAANPAAYICNRLYDLLLRDSIFFAFDLIRTTTGEDMGSEEEIRDYATSFLQRLNTQDSMDFAHVYLPLMMGGIILFDQVVAPDELLEETLRGMSEVLAMRDAEWSDENDLIFLMTKELVNRSSRLFGFQI